MPLFYKLYQNKNTKSSANNKWYARSAMTSTIDMEGLSEIMQRNCTVKKSDIRAVLKELVETMQDQLQESKRVKLDGFGTFKLGLCSRGVEMPGDFNVRQHIKSVHVLFQPELKIDAQGRRKQKLLDEVCVQEALKNDVDTSKKSDDTPSDTNP